MEKIKENKVTLLTILIIILIVLLLSIISSGNKKSKAKTIYSHNSKEITKEEIYKDMKFTNIALITEKGYTTFTAIVTNEGEDNNIEKFHIELLDKKGKVVIRLLGYMPGGLKKGETKDITASSKGQFNEVVAKRIVD